MNRLRELREKMNLRQTDVAEATGLDQRTLSNYETEKTNPDSFALVKLADFFGVSIDYLVGRTDMSIPTKEDVIKRLGKIRKDLEEIEKQIK